MTQPERLYTDLAQWWHLMSSPEEYAEEVDDFNRIISEVTDTPTKTILELGCGGGNNAFHMKKYYELTLVDLSLDMLENSRKLNPQCKHIQGDMRSVRLNRTFDAVFIHDAVMYMTTVQDLRLAMETAAHHCRPGGLSIWAPDHTVETFKPSTSHGGHDAVDGSGRGMRYVEWTSDPDPADTTFITDFAYLLRESNGAVRTEYDHHVMGIFSTQTWIRELERVGFTVTVFPDSFERAIFIGKRIG